MTSVDLTLSAQEDLKGIWVYTYKRWGEAQADTYFDRIVTSCQAIGEGIARSKSVDGLAPNIRVHRCEQHYIFFLAETRPIILAILHSRMNKLARLKHRF